MLAAERDTIVTRSQLKNLKTMNVWVVPRRRFSFNTWKTQYSMLCLILGSRKTQNELVLTINMIIQSLTLI